jgi:hypothetical protein
MRKQVENGDPNCRDLKFNITMCNGRKFESAGIQDGKSSGDAPVLPLHYKLCILIDDARCGRLTASVLLIVWVQVC